MSNIDTAEIARMLASTAGEVERRHRAVQDVLRWFSWDHLSDQPGAPKRVSAAIAELAGYMLVEIPADDPELTRGLHKLIEAKDCLVRAAIAAQTAAAE